LTCSRSSGEDNSSASADPSSSEQSCDTVIYVGPIDDATDGEHPPVYLPSLNSGDNRCSMSKVLRGSTAEQQQTEQRNKIHHSSPSKSSQGAHSAARKAEEIKVGPMKTVVSKVQNPVKPVPMNRSPQAQRKSSKTESTLPAEAVKSGKSDEQWIDGPRIHKSRMSDVRHMVRHQRETWIDGPPMGPASASATAAASGAAALGYGFMDEHKQGMIRQWVETQSAQVSGFDAHRRHVFYRSPDAPAPPGVLFFKY
jgi:kinesin family member 26